jgi:hypothetical protein
LNREAVIVILLDTKTGSLEKVHDWMLVPKPIVRNAIAIIFRRRYTVAVNVNELNVQHEIAVPPALRRIDHASLSRRTTE